MAKNVDDKFYDSADAHIHLSNDQLKEIGSGIDKYLETGSIREIRAKSGAHLNFTLYAL